MEKRTGLQRVFWPFDRAGHILMRHVSLLMAIFELTVVAVRTTWEGRPKGKVRPYAYDSIGSEILMQVYFTGVQALPIIIALGLATGSAAIMQAVSQFNMVGGQQIVGQFLVLTIGREVAPMLVAIVVIARSATAVATHLGNMRASGEIDALESMGIHPYRYVVYPRLLGGIISMGCLAAYFLLFAFIGGYVLTSVFHEMDPRFFASLLLDALGELEGWFVFFLKVVVNAIMIFSIACFYGLQVGRTHHEVPIATTKAVMRCLSYVVTFNISVSILFYMILFATRGSL